MYGLLDRLIAMGGKLTLILYQVDWNTVARDLGISNGHAARMRYSRFKGQIDPSRVKKKAPKKAEKGDPKGVLSMPMHLQPRMDIATINSGLVPKAEPMNAHCQQHPFVKCEPDHHVPGEGNLPDGSEADRNLSYPMPSGSMAPPPHVSQYVPSSLPFSGAQSLPGIMPFSSSTPLAPYSMIPMSQEIRMDEVGMHSPFINHAPMMNNGPMIAWEPTSAPSRENAPVAPRSESHPVSFNNAPIIAWEATSAPPREHSPGVSRNEPTQVSIHNAPVIAWEPIPAPPREHSSVAPRSESTPVSVKEEPEATENKIDVAVPIKVEGNGQKE